MAQKYPRDRFDTIPNGIERVGAHRAPARRGAGWIRFGWAALVTAVIVGAGVIGIMFVNQGLTDEAAPAPTPTPTATAVPTVAPDIPVTVLNGTTTSGLAARAGDQLTAAGIPLGTVTNASESDLTETYVYYASPELEGAARGVAAAIPDSDVRYDAKFAEIGTPLVLVLGSDYAAATGG